MTTSDKEREARLAAALRENLRRRKAQARAAAQIEEEIPLDQSSAGPPPHSGED